MRRVGLLFTLLWAVGVSALATQTWWSMSPLQRYYVRPEIQGELLAHIRVPSLNLSQPPAEPRVAVVLYTPPSGWRWYVQTASRVTGELRSTYPAPLLPQASRAAVIAAAEAVLVYVIVLSLARMLARRERPGTAPPGR